MTRNTPNNYSSQDFLNMINKAVSVSFPAEHSYEFMLDVVEKAPTLKMLMPFYKTTASGNIEVLSVAQKKIKSETYADKNTQTDGITQGKIPYALTEVYWDTWIKNNDVVYNLNRMMNNRGLLAGKTPNFETAVITLIQQAFAFDLQMLVFNGDTAYPASKTYTDFYKIKDGFVKKALASTHKIDASTTTPKIADIIKLVQLLPEKWRNAFPLEGQIKWFMQRGTHDRIVAELTERATPFGDAIMKDGVLKKLVGYEVEIVSGMEGPLVDSSDPDQGNKGFLMLTPVANLAPVYGVDRGMVSYDRVNVGTTAVQRKSTYHILRSMLDVIIGDVDAIAYMVGTNL